MSFPPSGILRGMACSPVGLISLKDRELRPVIDKVRDRFPVKPEFFRFLINRLGCLCNCQDHFHFHIFIRSSKYESFSYIFHSSLQMLPALYHGVLGFILKVNMVVESGHSLILILWSSREYSLINATAIWVSLAVWRTCLLLLDKNYQKPLLSWGW